MGIAAKVLTRILLGLGALGVAACAARGGTPARGPMVTERSYYADSSLMEAFQE